MKNKKGFIATTLIYSFFLVFIAVILAFIIMAVHNKNLIAKANDSIRKDLAEKKLGNRDIGSYVDYKINVEDMETNDIKWIIFNNDSNKTELISSGVVFTHTDFEFIKQVISSIDDDCYISNVRLVDYNDIYNVVDYNVDTVKQLQAILNLDTRGSEDQTARANYLVLQNGEPKRYTYKEPTSSSEQNSLDAYKSKAFQESNLTIYPTGAKMNVRLVITLSANTKIIAGDGSYGSPYNISTDKCYKETFLLNKILSKGYDNKTNYTIPGQQSPTTDEGLRTTTDDFGTSYYYRGLVEDNYVAFNNMCWRITRIDGLGNIYLLLQVNGTVNGKVDCSYDGFGVGQVALKSNQLQGHTEMSELAESSGTIFKYKWNNVGTDNTYAGLMYGEEDQTTYDDTHAMLHDSNILTALKLWYDVKLIANRDKIADVIWCNDLQPIQGGSYTGIGKTRTYYEGENRAATIGPSFKCKNQNTTHDIGKYSATIGFGGNGKLSSGGVHYKIGTLTVDDVMFAGGMYTVDTNFQSNTYLTKTMSSSAWLISPWSFNPAAGRGVYMMYLSPDGRISNTLVTSTGIGIRPMIALKPTVQATGNGTLRNPYVIE